MIGTQCKLQGLVIRGDTRNQSRTKQASNHFKFNWLLRGHSNGLVTALNRFCSGLQGPFDCIATKKITLHWQQPKLSRRIHSVQWIAFTFSQERIARLVVSTTRDSPRLKTQKIRKLVGALENQKTMLVIIKLLQLWTECTIRTLPDLFDFLKNSNFSISGGRSRAGAIQSASAVFSPFSTLVSL